MNCTHARFALPALLYGDLKPDQAIALRQHLAACPACQAEYAVLERLRQGLDAVPSTPAVQVDLAKLFQEAGRRQERRLRQWRRTAALLAVAAAGLILVLGLLNLEVRVEGHQFLVRWGNPPAPPVNPEEPTPQQLVQAPPSVNLVSPADVQLLRDLVHALEADVRIRDQKQHQALSQLRARLDSLQQRSDQRWADAERTQRAFYTALFGSRETKGERP